MKFLFSILTLGAYCCDTAQAYVTGSSPLGNAEWLKNTGAKSAFAPAPVNKDVNGIFLEEYHAWANRYGKSTSDLDRFEIFKVNFLLQMQHNKKTGTFRELNEYGDMTAKEFELGEYSKTQNDGKTTTGRTSTGNLVEVELLDEDPIPKVRKLDSETIPRVSSFDTTRHRPRQPDGPSYVHGDYQEDRPYVQRQQHQYEPSGPKVYQSQDRWIDQPPQPRKKRRFVRFGPDQIL